MNILKYKLPILKRKRRTLIVDNNDLLRLKLSIYNIHKNTSKIPLNLKHINFYDIPDIKIDNSKDNNNNLETIDYENNAIKEFLYHNINYKKYLKPINKLTKNKSTINIYKNKYDFLFSENFEKEINDNQNNKTFLLFKKYNRKFINNPNINKITNINKYLIKKNENDTNGNFIYNDYNEEKKESITFIMNNNNTKELYKKKLTKKFPENKIFKKDKNINNFKFYGKRFNSPTIKNIKRIQFLQEIIQQKNKENKIIKNKYKSNSKENLNNDRYNYILKGKIKNIESKINVTIKNINNVNKLLLSCLNNSKNQFEADTKIIFGNKF